VTGALPAVIGAARAAARREDVAALDALVDWPLSGVGAVLAALHRIDPGDRPAVVSRALADLHSTDPAARSGTLRHLQRALVEAHRVEPAGEHERRALRIAIDASPVPLEFPELADLAARAAAVTGVYVAVGTALVFGVADGKLVVPR
jgi:hypothetical protein